MCVVLYVKVALNDVPEPGEVGLDSTIFFAQGQYTFDGKRCLRYHEGNELIKSIS